MVDKPGVITTAQLADIEAICSARPGASGRSTSPSASRCRAMTRAAELVRRARSAAWCRPWASARTGSTATCGPTGSSEPRRRRRHPRRHRLAPDRPVPALHRLRGRRDRRQRGRQLRQPGDSRVRGLRRDPAAQRARPAAISGSTGTPPDGLPTWGDGRLHHPRHRGLHRAAQIRRHRRPRRHRPPVPGRPRGDPPHRLPRRAAALLRAPDRRRVRAHRDARCRRRTASRSASWRSRRRPGPCASPDRPAARPATGSPARMAADCGA